MAIKSIIIIPYIMSAIVVCSCVSFNEENNVTSADVVMETKSNITWLVKCPSRCSCYKGIISDKFSSTYFKLQAAVKIINCSNAGFETPPRKMPLDAQALFMNNNNFIELRKLPYIPGLLYIDVSNCSIRVLDNFFLFSHFKELQYLSLRNNKISNLRQGSFSGMPNLTHLDISLNNIEDIASNSFAGLNHLLQLDLHGNLLRQLDFSWFEDVFNLRQLDLSSNLLRTIKNKDLYALSELNLLHLSNNIIRTIENYVFKKHSNLLMLELDRNQLTSVPTKALQMASVLKKINLDSNPIPKLRKQDFSDMSLSSISICYMTKLTCIEASAFYNMPNLSVVHAHDNPRLIFIDSKAFQIVPKLKTLFIHNNQLTALSPGIVDCVPSLQEIHLYRNPITCDCNAFWIRELLLEADAKNFSKPFFNDSDSIKCDYPLNLTGQSIGEVEEGLFGRVCAPTTLPAFSENYTLSVGEELRLECHTYGVPEPKLTWLLPDGSEVTNRTDLDRIEILDSCIFIVRYLRTSDSGTYGCKSNNGVGFDISSTRIKVNNKPVKLLLNTISSNYVALSWNGSGHRSMISDYQLQYRPVKGTKDKVAQPFTVIPLQPYHYSYTIQNLNASTMYEFCIVYVYETELYKVDCRKIKTKSYDSESSAIKKIISEKIIAGVCTALGLVMFLACMVTLVKKFKFHKDYDPPYESDESINIPLENVYQPLTTPLCSSSTSLLNVSTRKASFDEY